MDWATVRRETARSRSSGITFSFSDEVIGAGKWWAWSGPVEPPENPVKAMTPDPARPREIEVTIDPAVAVGLDVHWGREELERLKAPAADFPGLHHSRGWRR